jgi:hypothetical protein
MLFRKGQQHVSGKLLARLLDGEAPCHDLAKFTLQNLSSRADRDDSMISSAQAFSPNTGSGIATRLTSRT